MSDVTIWHNARCSKSRQAKALLDEGLAGSAAVEVREYLKEPPTREELDDLMGRLGITDPRLMMRTGEDAYRQLGLADAGPDELLEAIVEHPILLERPIVVRGDRARIGRPPEQIRDLF